MIVLHLPIWCKRYGESLRCLCAQSEDHVYVESGSLCIAIDLVDVILFLFYSSSSIVLILPASCKVAPVDF